MEEACVVFCWYHVYISPSRSPPRSRLLRRLSGRSPGCLLQPLPAVQQRMPRYCAKHMSRRNKRNSPGVMPLYRNRWTEINGTNMGCGRGRLFTCLALPPSPLSRYLLYRPYINAEPWLCARIPRSSPRTYKPDVVWRKSALDLAAARQQHQDKRIS